MVKRLCVWNDLSHGCKKDLCHVVSEVFFSFVVGWIVCSLDCLVIYGGLSYVSFGVVNHLSKTWVVIRLCGSGMDEVVRLLKSKGIQLPGRGRQLDEEEKTKRKLFAKYELRKRRQTERHVLRKEMAVHAIPQLFVSQRSDKIPNGFNCALCQTDISFLSRGAPEIWRHFSRKSHYLKDRRYRLDHEDVFYTPQFDAVEVATISAELRAEIEETPPVILGKKNPFREDEVHALVGVVSNVPSATLVGGYLSFSIVVVPIVSCDVFGTSSVLPSQWSRPMRKLRGVKLSLLSLSVRRYILVFFVECSLGVRILYSVCHFARRAMESIVLFDVKLMGVFERCAFRGSLTVLAFVMRKSVACRGSYLSWLRNSLLLLCSAALQLCSTCSVSGVGHMVGHRLSLCCSIRRQSSRIMFGKQVWSVPTVWILLRFWSSCYYAWIKPFISPGY